MKNKNTPWTWEEIKALDTAGRKKFIDDYGDRGKVALLGATVTERWCEGGWPHDDLDIPDCYAKPSWAGWRCSDCPLVEENPKCNTRREIMDKVYRRLVERDGLLPLEKEQGR